MFAYIDCTGRVQVDRPPQSLNERLALKATSSGTSRDFVKKESCMLRLINPAHHGSPFLKCKTQCTACLYWMIPAYHGQIHRSVLWSTRLFDSTPTSVINHGNSTLKMRTAMLSHYHRNTLSSITTRRDWKPIFGVHFVISILYGGNWTHRFLQVTINAVWVSWQAINLGLCTSKNWFVGEVHCWQDALCILSEWCSCHSWTCQNASLG